MLQLCRGTCVLKRLLQGPPRHIVEGPTKVNTHHDTSMTFASDPSVSSLMHCEHRVSHTLSHTPAVLCHAADGIIYGFGGAVGILWAGLEVFQCAGL